MKLIYIILITLLLIASILTTANIFVYDKHSYYETGSLANAIKSGIEDKSIIGIYEIKSNNQYNRIQVGLERMLLTNYYKYLYYTPIYYSDNYYLCADQLKYQKLKEDYIIKDKADTLCTVKSVANSLISPINHVPDTLTILIKDTAYNLILVRKFDENIKKKPSISLFDKLSLGPLFSN